MDEQEKELRKKELLAGFHATMADQLLVWPKALVSLVWS
jgi:hypothetical protein